MVHCFLDVATNNGPFLVTNSYVSGKALSTLTLATTVPSGGSLTGTVEVNVTDSKASLFKLSSSNNLALGVPSSVTIPANLQQAGFLGFAGVVDVNTKVSVTAAGGGVSRQVGITVLPNALASVTLSVPSTKAGGTVTATVHLDAPTGIHGRIVALNSDSASVATLPASVHIVPGDSLATFSVKTIAGKSGYVTISATALGVTHSVGLIVSP